MKTIRKILSMILMLAMVMAMATTAMAADSKSYESTTNYHAWYNYIHQPEVWGNVSIVDSFAYEEAHNDPHDYVDTDEFNKLSNTYAYLNDTFGVRIAIVWLCNANAGLTSNDAKNRADTFLNYLLSGQFDTEFVKMQAVYGDEWAEKFGRQVGMTRENGNSMLKDYARFVSNNTRINTAENVARNSYRVEGTYVLEKLTLNAKGQYIPDIMAPLTDIAAAIAIAKPVAEVIIRDFMRNDMRHYDSMLLDIVEGICFPESDPRSLVNRPITAEKAVEIAIAAITADDNENEIFAIGRVSAKAINTYRLNDQPQFMANDLDTPVTSKTTITVNGVATQLESVVLTNAKGGATTYFKLRELVPLLTDGNSYHVGYGDWKRTTGYTSAGLAITEKFDAGIWIGDAHVAENTVAPVLAANRDSRTSVVPVLVSARNDTVIQDRYLVADLEAVVLTNAAGGATTYFKLRDIAGFYGYNVDWSATAGITVTNAK